MNPVVSLTPAKNCFEMTAAKEPYRKKSYHSNTVPRLEAMITRRGDRAIPDEPIGAVTATI
jgi:hypothetical protein